MSAFKDFLPAWNLLPMESSDSINGLQNHAAKLMSIPWVLMTDADADPVCEITKAIASDKDGQKASFAAFNVFVVAKEAPCPASPRGRALERTSQVMTKLQARDGKSFEAWGTEPDGAPKGGIVILQEIFGITTS